MLKKYREVARSCVFKNVDGLWKWFVECSDDYKENSEYIIHPLIDVDTDLEFSELEFLDSDSYVIYEILNVDQ